jgi:hypothetical protein
MTRIENYRQILSRLDDWDEYLRAESHLPGPRGNLELAHAAADLTDRARCEHFLTFNSLRAPVNTPDEFLAFCGVEGLGRLIAEGQADLWPTLRGCASDPRWRLREAVAMALQRVGQVDMNLLLEKMEDWSSGNWLEMRAVAAGLAEPILLQKEGHILQALELFAHITAAVERAQVREESFKVLCKGLGYCWSVLVAALPEQGKVALEPWLSNPDKDVRWIMKENLKKNRLVRMDKGWVEACLAKLV